MRDKAMRVLRSDVIPYDSMHALILHARTCAPLGEEGDEGTPPPVLDG